jgi:chromosome segregation ATPase
VFCNKSVGNDGGAINTGMEEALYEVIASGIVRQFDNRPAPVDPCANVKTELANANKIIATKDSEINKLNGALGGMTTDRNKFKNLSEELQSSLDNKTAEINRLNLELEDTKKLLKQSELNLDIAENELANVAGKFSELDRLVAQQSAKIVHQSTELTKLSDALVRCKADRGTTLVEFVQNIINKLKK